MAHSEPFLPNLPDFPLVLSPMEAITNPAFRTICKKWGADILVTEFIASDALIRDIRSSLRKMTFTKEERPIGIQIFGNEENALRKAAEIAASANPDFIDINWGCPVRKIAGRGCGSGILKNIPLMIHLTEAVVKAVDNIPVTVKTRLGYDCEDKPIVEIAERLQDVGIKAIAIHGRTKSQMYKGDADWTLIGKVKENPRMYIPVYGNGDITTPEKAMEYKKRYGVDGMLIGRATMGNPFLFKQIKEFLEGKQDYFRPDVHQRVSTCREHLHRLCEWRGNKSGVLEMRSHYGGYFRGLPNFKPYRLQLVSLTEIEDLLVVLSDIETTYSDTD